MNGYFLGSAKEDLKSGGARGLVNAMSNAKRAIDCQTDTLLNAIGYSPRQLDKQLGRTVILSLSQFTANQAQPLKFRVLESLGIVTPAIVSRVRRIRNLLEHEYKMPTPRVVRDALDIAALYVSAGEGAMKSFLMDVWLGSGEANYPSGLGDTDFRTTISIRLVWDHRPAIEVGYCDRERRESASMTIKPPDSTYLALLRVLFAVRSRDNVEAAIAFAVSNSGFPLTKAMVKVVSIGPF